MPEKPDSKRGRVRTHFREHGEEAALAFGQEQGIKPARLKRWFKMWADKPATPARGEPPIKVKAGSKVYAGKARIYLFDDTDKQGTLIDQGPQQSVIRWDNGNEQIVANDWFSPLPPEKDRKRRVV